MLTRTNEDMNAPLGPYSRPMPRALWWSQAGVVLMSEVPLWGVGAYPRKQMLTRTNEDMSGCHALFTWHSGLSVWGPGSWCDHCVTTGVHRRPLGPYSRTMPRALWGSYEGGHERVPRLVHLPCKVESSDQISI